MKITSLTTCRELLVGVEGSCCEASCVSKVNIPDGFVVATDYERNYVTRLLTV